MSRPQNHKKWDAAKIKRFNRIVVIVAIVPALAIVIIFNIVAKQNNKILDEGLRQTVVIVDKYKTGTRKNFSYHMEIAWFTDGEKIPVYNSKDTIGMSKDEKFSDDVLSEVFKDVNRTKLGDYNAFKLKYVSGKTYSKLEIGDKATLVYMEGQPKDGLLITNEKEKHKSKH